MMASSSTAKSEPQNGTAVQQIIRACDMCRKKKIRCELTTDVCVQCIKYKTECHFTPILTKGGPRRPVGQKYVEKLEGRLKALEAVLGLSGQTDQVLMDGTRQTFSETPNRKRGAPSDDSVLGKARRAKLPSREQSNSESSVEDRNCSVSPSVNYSRSSSETRRIVDGDLYLREQPASSGNSSITVSNWRHTALSDVFPRQYFRSLPPKEEALALYEEYFVCFNTAFPVFEQRSFMQMVEERYSNEERQDPAWWACLNVMLSLGHRFRAMTTSKPQQNEMKAWEYMQNALTVVNELTMLSSSLLAVQALLGMAIVMQGTPNPRPCYVLIANTMRLAQGMGLHRQYHQPGLSDAEIEQRKRVFWIAYIVDKDVSLRTGQPPAQDDDDMDVELPSETIDDVIYHQGGSGQINFFNLRIGLAIIQGQIYKRSYAVKATRQSELDRMAAVQDLDILLETWKSSFPAHFEIENLKDFLRTPTISKITTVIHTVILRLTYFYSVNSIHHHSAHNPPWEGGLYHTPGALDGSGVLLEGLGVLEARNAIKLIQIIPRGDYACIWLVIHFFVLATTTLLSHTIKNPGHPLAQSDCQLTNPVLKLLEALEKEGKSDDIKRMNKFCVDLRRQAIDAIESRAAVWNINMTENSNIEIPAKESLEDFIRRVEGIANCDPVPNFILPQQQQRSATRAGEFSRAFETP